ncbi:MAG: ribosomal protein S18-alanine N-acetyltransferase [Planctomycetaceae bacterium]|jgi:ribosomal-protein-alanine N-acetyltransferase|nr:ribosomal protein S18-alanine N-acetyltransferase [Planctomycetaceae bacterium]
MELYQEKDIRVNVRWMIRNDFAEVMAIEQYSFEFPWNEEEFLRCLQSRSCIGVVADYRGKVVGYAIYETPRNKIFLTNIAVADEFRRKGVARQIVQKLVRKLTYQNRRKILIEIRETNLTALQCFRSLGFMATGTLRNFYEEQDEDAYILSYQLDTVRRAEPETAGVMVS